MTLIKSISGIRGTIGGSVGDNLTPVDLTKFTAAYGTWLKKRNGNKQLSVVLGRDARMSGEMAEQIVSGTLNGVGINVVNVGLASTPTVEIAVTNENVDGGIILTASHNPKQWNALKLLNEKGEFLDAEDGRQVLEIAETESFDFVDVDSLGATEDFGDYTDIHINNVLSLDLVNVEAIKKANFKVAIDAVNSVGGIAIPRLLNALGVTNVVELYCEPNGDFPHNPEPLPEHLTEISSVVVDKGCDVGFVVDPDVDRLAMVCEDGTMFGEEYTLVSIADYVLSNTPGNTSSNMSSTRALRDVTEKYGCSYTAAAVGEVNVVKAMKSTDAIIGGEGNGGIIYPASHYGRDALVGVGLFLSLLAEKKNKCSELRASYPEYYISKNKIQLTPEIDVDAVLKAVKDEYSDFDVNDIDGVKIDFAKGWVHLRKSNTEPIIRIYSEASNKELADKQAQKVIDKVLSL